MTKYPLYSLGASALFIVGALVLLLFGNTKDPEVTLFLGLIMANIPGLVASFMAERNNKAINNGVIEEKARRGTTTALAEQQVLTRTGPVETAQLQALTALLKRVSKVEDKQNGTTV